jgi:hypothetical protein
VWGIATPVGSPLPLELFVSGDAAGATTAAPITAAWSIRAIPEDGVEEEDGGEADGGGASGGEPAHQTDASVAVAGLVGGVALGPPSPLTAVFLRPGLFRVSAVVGRGAGGRVGADALFVRAE